MDQSPIQFHPHALERIIERGATEDEVRMTIRGGEQFAVKFGRSGFRRNFAFESEWRGRRYQTKQVEAIAVEEDGGWTVITVITRFFGKINED